MTNANRDQNNVPTALCVLNSDGQTLVRLAANPANNNSLKVDDNTTGSDNGPDEALRDENYVTTMLATSSVDGETPVVVYTDSSGKLLIDSN